MTSACCSVVMPRPRTRRPRATRRGRRASHRRSADRWGVLRAKLAHHDGRAVRAHDFDDLASVAPIRRGLLDVASELGEAPRSKLDGRADLIVDRKQSHQVTRPSDAPAAYVRIKLRSRCGL